MIEYEKEDNHTEIYEKINHIHSIAEEYIDNKEEYFNLLNYCKEQFRTIGAVSILALLTMTAFIMPEYFNNDFDINYVKPLLVLSPFFLVGSMIGIFNNYIIQKTPFLKHAIAKRKNEMEKSFNRGISQQEQLNYLLFIDILIDKCSINHLKYQEEKLELIELKEELISICAINDQEELMEFIYYNSDYLEETLTEFLEASSAKTVEETKFQSVYENFLSSTGIILSQYNNPGQNIKKLL